MTCEVRKEVGRHAAARYAQRLAVEVVARPSRVVLRRDGDLGVAELLRALEELHARQAKLRSERVAQTQ